MSDTELVLIEFTKLAGPAWAAVDAGADALRGGCIRPSAVTHKQSTEAGKGQPSTRARTLFVAGVFLPLLLLLNVALHIRSAVPAPPVRVNHPSH